MAYINTLTPDNLENRGWVNFLTGRIYQVVFMELSAREQTELVASNHLLDVALLIKAREYRKQNRTDRKKIYIYIHE